MDNRSAERRPAVKGSWEDILAQAEDHARNFNDAAFPLYHRVVDGLARLSPALRDAGDKRLFKLFMRAAMDLQGYYNVRGRFDDALKVVDQMRTVVTEADDQQMADLLSAQIHRLAGRFEEGIAPLRAKVESPNAKLADWHPLLWAHIEQQRAAEALDLLPRFQAAVAAAAAAPATEGDDATEDDGEVDDPINYGRAMRALLLLEAGRFEESFAAYDELFESGADVSGNAAMAYTRLTLLGRYEDALRFIERDREHPVRAAFWRGLIARLTHDAKRSRHHFETASNPDLVKQDQRSIIEHITARYFLGDPNAEALETVLGLLREERNVGWVPLYLAGLGWTVRNDYVAARSNLRIAATQIKWSAEAPGIPPLYWMITQSLVPAEHHAELEEYFDTRVATPAQLGEAAPTDDAATPDGQ